MTTASWRFSMRLARREVRRRPGRTLLVTLLIALPVCGMTMITVLVRSSDKPGQEFAREFGAADLVAGERPAGGLPPGVLQGLPTAKARRAAVAAQVPSTLPNVAFPSGTHVVRTHDWTNFIGLADAAGAARLSHATDLDLNDSVARGIVLLRSGRYPARAGEALLSPKLAKAFGVSVGDTLHLETPQWTEKVVGTGVLATNWSDGLIAVRGNELSNTAGMQTGQLELVDLPGHPTDAQLRAYPEPFFSRASNVGSTANRAVNWVLVGGIVALVIIGIVISGAFAVGARRQLVTLGQLSANGADERLLRRTLSLQGFLSGAIGSATGFVAGVVLLIALQDQFANLIHHDPGPYVWSARDAVAILITGMVTATVAAFIPARSASQVPVLTALAGRRPLGRMPRRLVPVGLTLFGSGVFVLALVATASGNGRSDGLAFSAVLGGMLVLAGACCASSVAVAALAGAARRARGAARVAIRSVVRSRARSAAVVMALAAMNAGAIAIATAIDSHTGARVHDAAFMPDDTLLVSSAGDLSGDIRQFLPPPASVTASLHTLLPNAHWTVRRAVVGSDTGGGIPDAPIGQKDVSVYTPPIATVTDPEILRMIGLSDKDAAELRHYGMITVHPVEDSSGHALETVRVQLGSPARTVVAAVAHDSVRAVGDAEGFYITEAKARALGLPIVNAGDLVRNPTPFTDSQKASLLVTETALGNSPGTMSTFIAWSGATANDISPAVAREIILGIVLFLALCVLAMSLALSAAETRDERDILVSLGARPSMMRSVSGWKAAVLACAGAVLAIPTGFVPVYVVFHAVARSGESAHVAFPWLTIAQLVLLAPLVAGVVAYFGSAIAQAVKPTRMSTFATD